MSFNYPRRVKDLPTLDPDSEDDFNTPIKTNASVSKKASTNIEYNEKNKENEGGNMSNFKLGSGCKNNTNLRIPKRSSELPTLESDSEDEENNLNCAILNDSFIINEQDESNSSMRNACESSATKVKKNHTSDSFVLHFNKMVLDSESKKANNAKSANACSSKQSSTNRSSPPQNDQNRDIVAPLIRINSEPIREKEPMNDIDLETPFKNKDSNIQALTNVAPPTDTHFATPQVQSFSLRRRPRDLCSTQSQKTRLAIVNEFRSQKVLFQTPMAVSRAPIACTSNDSITLSLCDTINEVNSAPNTAEKLAKQETEKDLTRKSKKSLEGKLNSTENENKIENSQINATQSSATSTGSTHKERILTINTVDYVILTKLGAGGSSSVYLARRKDNDKECALKVVDLHGDPIAVEGYLNETKLLAKLQGNICVVALYDYQMLQKESKLYMVMEKGDSDLHKILQTYTTSLPLYVLMNFLYQMLQAVNYIHQNGVIHSDLKPANFLMVHGRLKLIDFGIASNIAIDSTSIIKFSQAGTFNYISPEALTDTSTGSSPMRNNQPKIKISTKSDVWSLGCILYLFLYKKTPFSHIKNIYAKINTICNPNTEIEYPNLAPYYPKMLLFMVQKCLQHDPKKRPSCAELLQYPFNMVIPIQNLSVPTNQS